MQRQVASKELVSAVVPLGVVLTVGNILLFALTNGLDRMRGPPDANFLALVCFLSAFMSAEASLVAIWMAFGKRPLPVRLALAVPGVAIVFLPVFRWPNGALALGGGIIAVVVGALPLLAARAWGWRLMRFSTVTDAENWRPADNPMQFTLRQMFGWTLAVAMIAGLMRLVFRPEDFRSGMGVSLLMDGAVCIACGCVALAAVWATLGRRYPLRRLIGVVVVAGLVALLILGMFSVNDQTFIMITVGWAALNALLTCLGLLLFRPVGFRLVRSSGKTADNRRDSSVPAVKTT
jgi:hypothetical protein